MGLSIDERPSWRLRIMSWNIHGMRGRDGRSDPERVALVIEEARADVAGLQEVGALGGPGELLDPAGTLARLTGLAQAYGLTELRGGYPYGNCILSRHPITATRSYDLSVAGREKRGCLRADVDLGGSSLHVFNCHLGLDRRERRRQAAQLALGRHPARRRARLPAGPGGRLQRLEQPLGGAALDPAAAVGRGGSGSRARAPPSRRCSRWCGSTAPTWSSAVRVLACTVHDSALARLASDHLPVVTEHRVGEGHGARPPARPITAARGHHARSVEPTARSLSAPARRCVSASSGAANTGGEHGVSSRTRGEPAGIQAEGARAARARSGPTRCSRSR